MKKISTLLLLFFVSACQNIGNLKSKDYEELVYNYNRHLELSKNYKNVKIKTYTPNEHDFLFDINNIIQNLKTTDIHIVKSHSLYIVKYEPEMGGSFVSSCYDYNGWYYYCGKPLIFIYGLKVADGVTIYEDVYLEYVDILTYNSVLEKTFSGNIKYYNNEDEEEDDTKNNPSAQIDIEHKSTKIKGESSIYSFKLIENTKDIKELEDLKASINFRKISKLQELCPNLPEKYEDYLNCVEETKHENVEKTKQSLQQTKRTKRG